MPPSSTLTTVKTPTMVGFDGFEGTPQERTQDFFVEPDRSGWDGEDWQSAYEERAATLEYDEGLPRPGAEALAREWVIAEIERTTRRDLVGDYCE